MSSSNTLELPFSPCHPQEYSHERSAQLCKTILEYTRFPPVPRVPAARQEVESREQQ